MDDEEWTGSGFDRLGEKGLDLADRTAGSLADHPKKWGCLAAMIVLVLIIAGIVLSIAKPWADEGKRIFGPANVSNQFATVIQDWQDLISSSDRACSASKASLTSNDPTFVEDPALAYKFSYQNVRADYNRRMQNFFEAKLVGPSGYPRTVPDFPETHDPAGDWCQVSTQLETLHS